MRGREGERTNFQRPLTVEWLPNPTIGETDKHKPAHDSVAHKLQPNTHSFRWNCHQLEILLLLVVRFVFPVIDDKLTNPLRFHPICLRSVRHVRQLSVTKISESQLAFAWRIVFQHPFLFAHHSSCRHLWRHIAAFHKSKSLTTLFGKEPPDKVVSEEEQITNSKLISISQNTQVFLWKKNGREREENKRWKSEFKGLICLEKVLSNPWPQNLRHRLAQPLIPLRHLAILKEKGL